MPSVREYEETHLAEQQRFAKEKRELAGQVGSSCLLVGTLATRLLWTGIRCGWLAGCWWPHHCTVRLGKVCNQLEYVQRLCQRCCVRHLLCRWPRCATSWSICSARQRSSERRRPPRWGGGAELSRAGGRKALGGRRAVRLHPAGCPNGGMCRAWCDLPRRAVTDLRCIPCLAVRAEQEAAIERERSALAARQKDEQRFAADSEAAQVRFCSPLDGKLGGWVRCASRAWCAAAPFRMHQAYPFPHNLVACMHPRPRRNHGGAQRSWQTSGVVDCVCPLLVAASPPWFIGREIAEIQGELADMRLSMPSVCSIPVA